MKVQHSQKQNGEKDRTKVWRILSNTFAFDFCSFTFSWLISWVENDVENNFPINQLLNYFNLNKKNQ